MKTWAMQYDCCKLCQSTDSPHHGNGLCKPCYFKSYKPKSAPQPTPTETTDTLELFVSALPLLFKDAGIIGYSVSYSNGTVTIKKLGTKLSATWPK